MIISVFRLIAFSDVNNSLLFPSGYKNLNFLCI
jgi:hypothetical protein